MLIYRYQLIVLICILNGGCNNSPAPYPRPMGYPRIDLPSEVSYDTYQSEICPFNFEYPEYGEISAEREDSCWVDIYFPPFDCKWHITYRNIEQSGKPRFVHQEEHRGLVYQHSKQASNIRNTEMSYDQGYGTLYEIYGNVGTPAQFFYSDSLDQHLVMTSFYFNTATKNDSLLPVINYMKKELQHMIQSIDWE